MELLHDLKEVRAKVYASKNVYEVIRFIEGRKEDVRILYDSKGKLWYWALAGFMIHPMFLEIGFENALYPKVKDKSEFYNNYVLKNEFIYLYYYKDKPVMENITGDYGMHYYYDFGMIDSKDILESVKVRYEDTDLYKILEPRLQRVEKELTKKDKSKVKNTYLFPEGYILNTDF